MTTQAVEHERDSAQEFLLNPCGETFAPLFRQFCPKLTRYYRFRCCSAAVAEELTQEVMLTVYQRASQLRQHENFRGWIFAIARNVLLQHMRRNGREIESVDISSVPAEALAAGDDMLLGSILRESMARLSLEDQQLLSLRHLDGLEYHEIATAMGMPLGTVQWRLFSIRKKLSTHFGRKAV
jgi:RNA polymerase sigma factor (sigma-70 family)